MALRAFVLVTLDASKTKEAYETLREKRPKGVNIVDLVSGRYDVVLDVETENIETLSKVINENVRKVSGVIKTETLITLEL
jgi:DNA-binding Lrp family transcriptional regulator